MNDIVRNALIAGSAQGVCPICGESGAHQHTKAENIIFRRGVELARGPEGQARFDAAVGALADIAHADDMTLDIARKKAARAYAQVMAGEPSADTGKG